MTGDDNDAIFDLLGMVNVVSQLGQFPFLSSMSYNEMNYSQQKRKRKKKMK